MSKSSITTDADLEANADFYRDTDGEWQIVLDTPGEILLQEFLGRMNISQNAIARAIHVSPRRINEIVLGKRAITADTSLRLAKFFGMSDRYWLNIQTDYDMRLQREEIEADLATIETYKTAA